MSSYPRYGSTRRHLKSDLSELIGYHLLGLEDGFVDPDDDELWENLEISRRISDAVLLVKQWGFDWEWRKDEEWIGDALAAVIEGTDGNDIAHLPYKSTTSSGKLIITSLTPLIKPISLDNVPRSIDDPRVRVLS